MLIKLIERSILKKKGDPHHGKKRSERSKVIESFNSRR